MGRDSDDDRSLGEVGHCGVAIDSAIDMDALFADIPLGDVTTSMTISGPAVPIFCMYLVAAERQGVDPAVLNGTLQTDIFKEYIAQKEWLFAPEPHLRLIADLMEYCERQIPAYKPLSVSGYHIREAGATAAQELAFTLADGFGYVELGMSRGMDVDTFAPGLSFFFDAHIDFFEEIAKFRAARRIWARWLRDVYGAKTDKAQWLRFHTQTAGVSLTGHQPYNNVVRTAVEALSAVLGGTNSLHTNALDEVLALPTEQAAEIAVRTQQVLMEETGVVNVADPLGGSWYVEALTDRIEAEAEAIFEKIREMGETETRWAQAYGPMTAGILRGIEDGWFMSEIAESAFWYQQQVEKGDKRVVGVNVHTDTITGDLDILRVSHEVETEQRRALVQRRACPRRRGGASCSGSDGRRCPRQREHDPVDAGRRSRRGDARRDLRCAPSRVGCLHRAGALLTPGLAARSPLGGGWAHECGEFHAAGCGRSVGPRGEVPSAGRRRKRGSGERRRRRHGRNVRGGGPDPVPDSAGGHRFVGRVVWAVQAALADPGEAGATSTTAGFCSRRSTSTPTHSSARHSRSSRSHPYLPSSRASRCRCSKAPSPSRRSAR